MVWGKQYNYYNVKKCTINGKVYDSKFEAGYAQELELRLKAKDIAGFDPHLRLPLIVNGYTVCDYYIDFAIYHNDGTIEYTECKGFATPTWKLKWRLFCALYEDDPNIKITLIMQGGGKPPKLRKKK